MFRQSRNAVGRSILNPIALLILSPLVAQAQSVAPADLARVLEVRETMHAALRSVLPWPGFRVDTIPLVYVFPERGQLLTNWHGPLPPGFSAVHGHPGFGWLITDTRGASNTSVDLAGRTVATMLMMNAPLADLAGVGAHEAFHVFEHTVKSDAHYLGEGENTFLVTTYPVFDTMNLAEAALEGRLLAAALRATSTDDVRRHAQQFAAIREVRHRRLGPMFSEFENKAELNEGIADYVQRRVTAASTGGSPVEAVARELETILDAPDRFRLRFYRTGPAMAFLLDRIGSESWKQTLTQERIFLAELVERAVGARPGQELVEASRQEQNFTALAHQARNAIGRLVHERRVQVDSLLSRPGVLLVVDTRGLNWCGFDPQNLLRASSALMVHTRFVRLCGNGLDIAVHTPAVEDRTDRELRAVIGSLDQIRITATENVVHLHDGETLDLTDVRFDSPAFTGQAARVRLTRSGRRLTLTTPRPEPR